MSKENNNLSIHDAFLAVFYIIITAIGINLCISRGLAAHPIHLYSITASIICISVLKFFKFKGEIKKHLVDLIFCSVLSVISISATISTLLF